MAETRFDSQSNPIYTYADYEYRALMGTARIGIRYFFPMPHEQQFLIGFGYEQNTLWDIEKTYSLVPHIMFAEADFIMPRTVLLPNVKLGWRAHRLTLTTDAC